MLAYACDGPFWRQHAGLPQSAALKLTQDAAAAAAWGLLHLPGRDAPGLSLDPAVIHYGQNSGFQAVNLARHLLLERPGHEARRILLLGFDFQPGAAGEIHFHGRHPAPLVNPLAADLARWARHFDPVPAQLERDGIDIINCSRATALRQFRRGALENSLQPDS